MNLFKWVEDMVNEVISGWLKQVTQIEEAVISPINGLVNQVMGGIWKGAGADKFVAEMKSVVLPMLASLLTINNGWANAMNKLQSTMQNATSQASSAVGGLVDFFSGMF